MASNIGSCLAVINKNELKTHEFSAAFHKLRIRISALLQDRTLAGRFSAAVVIKAVVEVCPPTESSTWERWARGLIGCLNKSDPWEVKRVYIAAIVRLFLLGRKSPLLQREITTPLLPPFITASLTSIRPVTAKQSQKNVIITSPLLPIVLRCWSELIQEHPVTFRPFVTRIRPICLSLVSDFASTSELQQLALQLLSFLHCCAPKASNASDWQLTLSNIVRATHDSLDLTLRGVHEEWTSNDSTQARQSVRQVYSKAPELAQFDAAGLGAWQGVFEGSARVANLLSWAASMLRSQSAPVAVPIGQLLDLVARVNAVTIPKGSNAAQYHLRHNPEVAQDEREALWASLPSLHISSLRLLSEVVESFGQASAPYVVSIFEQVFDLFDAEGSYESIRSQCYLCLTSTLQTDSTLGLHLDRHCLEAVSKACCRDLERLLPDSPDRKMDEDSINSTQNGSSILSTATQAQQPLPKATLDSDLLVDCAQRLLPLLLEKLPPDSLSHASRTEVDRLAILVNHQQAMFASVMNPPEQRAGPRVHSSILPFFARASEETGLNLEAIKRPRMPNITQMFPQSIDRPIHSTQNDDIAYTEEPFHPPQDHLMIETEPQSEPSIEGPEMSRKNMSTESNKPEPMPLSDTGTLGKRNFAAVDDVQAEPVAELDTSCPQNVDNYKRSRLEDGDDVSTAVDVMNEQMLTRNGLSGGDGDLLSQELSRRPIMSENSKMAPLNVEGDSDSDIPAINPELATDDEQDDIED